MSMFLTLAYLFFIGSVLGWCLELVFRKFFSSANPEHKWINPGFCVGPYVPLYGFGLCILYLLAHLGQVTGMDSTAGGKALMFLCMAVSMTAIEYIAGILLLKLMKLRLWDYSQLWGNIQGLICPLFSAIWAFMGAVYYFFVHPYILSALNWLSNNLAFSFVIGFFFGVFEVKGKAKPPLRRTGSFGAKGDTHTSRYLPFHIFATVVFPPSFFHSVRMAL